MTATTIRVPLGTLDDLPVGLGRAYDVAGTPIAVFRGRDDRVYAVGAVCPHKAGPLADGMLVGDQVVCPLHAYRFDGATGACDQGDDCTIQAYPIELEGTRVVVTMPAS